MRKEDFLNICQQNRLVAVLSKSADTAVSEADALIAKGVKVIEVTFRKEGADKVISQLSKKYAGTDVVIGAGTVLDAETARTAILAGAQFVVMPTADEGVIRLCNRYSIAVVPGIATANELLKVVDLGCDFVKLFPASLPTLKGLKGPFPNVRFMVTGGVTLDNAGDFIKAGAVSVGASALSADNADLWLNAVK